MDHAYWLGPLGRGTPVPGLVLLTMGYRGPPSLETRRPRLWFFFFGPFYLAWLRLWLEAVVLALVTCTAVHVTVLFTRRMLGGAVDFDVAVAQANLGTIRGAAPGDPGAASAYRELLGMLLPYYAAAFTLLLLMAVLTAFLPRYLHWRLGRTGPSSVDR